jgi:hypothetical protein
MTYFERHAELDRLEAITKSHSHECGGRLSVANDKGEPRLRCGVCGRFVSEDEIWISGKHKEDIMPIKGLSETLRLPRLGKIHLGVKVANKSGQGEHPEKVDYFVFPEEYRDSIERICGTDKPKSLDIMIPVEDAGIWASQFYRAYSRTRGLVCRGDGETAEQSVDVKTGELAWKGADVKSERRQVPCAGRECPHYQAKRCHERMCLQFILPRIPGLGVWQVDTGSINSILNINSDTAMVRSVVGRVSMVPLTLTLEPQDVNNPETGKKEKAYCMHLRVVGTLGELLAAAKKPFGLIEMPKPVQDLDAEDTEELDHEGYADADTPPCDKGTGEVQETEADREFAALGGPTDATTSPIMATIQQFDHIHAITGRAPDKEEAVKAWCQRTFNKPLGELTFEEAARTITAMEKAISKFATVR